MPPDPLTTLWAMTGGDGQHRVRWYSEPEGGWVDSWIDVGDRNRFMRVASTERAEISPGCWREGRLAEVHCLWAHLDCREAVVLMRGFRPTPTLWLSATGARRQTALWALRAPVKDGEALWHNELLAARLRGLKRAADATTFRVLAPGSKSGRGFVECVGCDPRLFDVDEVTHGLERKQQRWN